MLISTEIGCMFRMKQVNKNKNTGGEEVQIEGRECLEKHLKIRVN